MKIKASEMPLRDYFAAKWLQGWMANPSAPNHSPEGGAVLAYQWADTMLKARVAGTKAHWREFNNQEGESE
jgi:hypothetical protein